jgi:uncharacterized protein YbaP (TraB family)
MAMSSSGSVLITLVSEEMRQLLATRVQTAFHSQLALVVHETNVTRKYMNVIETRSTTNKFTSGNNEKKAIS